MPAKIEISYKTIVFAVFFLIFLWFLREIKDIIFWVFVAFILMSAFKPTVNAIEKKGIPRIIGILGIYLLVILLLVIVGSTLIPPLVTQTIHLVERLPGLVSPLVPFIQQDIQLLTQQVAPIGENIVRVTVGLFSNIVALFTIFVISFYLLLERSNLKTFLTNFLGKQSGESVIVVINKVEERLGAWVRGQVALIITIGVFTFIGLLILGIPYALPLAILAGMLEIIPTIGPILSAVPAVLVAFTISPLFALATAGVYFIVQQLENHLIVPYVMRRAVGLPPLVTIIAILIGARLAAVAGAILAVPIVVTIESVVTEYMKLKSPKE